MKKYFLNKNFFDKKYVRNVQYLNPINQNKKLYKRFINFITTN